MKNWFSQLLEQTPEGGRNAVRLALTFIVAASLATLVFAYVAIQSGAWQAYVVVAAFVGFLAIEVFVIRFAQRNQFNTAGILLVVNVCYIVLAMTAFMSGIGLGLSTALALVILEIVFETLSGPLATRVRISGIAFAIGMVFMDQFALWSRPALPAVQYAIPMIAAGTVIAIAALMLGRTWRDLNLARKLLFAFGGLFIFGLVIAASGLFGLNRVQGSYEDTLAGGIEIRFRSNQLNSTLLEARRREKDFLLRWRDEGFEAAFDNYVKPNRQYTADMKETLKRLEALAPVVGQASLADFSQAQYEANIVVMNEDLLVYEQSFASVVDLIEQRGFVDTGLEGEFRVAVQAIEEKIYGREGLDQMVITMLQMRRREKDYLLRGDQQYVENVTELTAQLKDQAATSEVLTPAEKAEVRTLADDYLTKFLSLVEKDKQVVDATEVFRAAASEIQTDAEQLETIGVQLAAQDIQTAQANSTQTFTITGITVLIALVLSITLAIVLSRQITRPVIQLTSAAHELETGNYDAHAEITSGDEIGTLAATFNGMARQIKQTLATIARRAAELQSVAEIATKASQATEMQDMLQTVVDLTKSSYSLYHAHIYLLDDEKTNLVLSSGAGEPGRVMVSEKRTIALDHQRSLVARAARTNEGAISNDVTKEPDFLPNPLLPETKAEMAIPISVGDNVLGVLDVQADHIDRFTNEDIAIVTTLAQQVAASLETLRQFQVSQKMARELGVVASVSTATATITETDRLLQEVVNKTKSAFNLYHAHIYLMNEAEDTLVLAAGAGDVGKQMVSEGRQIPLDSEKSLVARAARTRIGAAVNDVTADPDFLPNPLLPDTRSEQAVPMIVGDKVLGVLDVQSEQLNRFTEIDVNINTTLASQVAVALQNSRTFSQAQRQAERESRLNAIGQKIQGATTVEAVLQIAARELGRALDAPLTIAQLGMGAKAAVNSNGNGNGNGH